MNATKWMCGLALGAALVIGCDRSKEDTPKKTTPAPTTPDVTPKAGGGSGATSDAGGADTGKAPVTSTGPSDAPPTDDAKAAERTKQVQELLDKAMAAMKEKKVDEARKALDNAEAMSDSVDETLRQQIKTARASVDNLEKAPAAPTDAPLPPTVPPAPKPPAPEDENK